VISDGARLDAARESALFVAGVLRVETPTLRRCRDRLSQRPLRRPLPHRHRRVGRWFRPAGQVAPLGVLDGAEFGWMHT
jgi:hypothetical protein